MLQCLKVRPISSTGVNIEPEGPNTPVDHICLKSETTAGDRQPQVRLGQRVVIRPSRGSEPEDFCATTVYSA